MRKFSRYPYVPPPSPTLRNWTMNRRGFTLCAGASLILVFLATTTFFFYPSSDTLISTKPLSSSQHSFSSSGPWEIPLGAGLSPQTPATAEEQAWIFNVERDGRKYGLTDAQCHAAFPDFFYEIERAKEYRKSKGLGMITPDDVDIAWKKDEIVRVLIYDSQMYIVDAHWADHGFDVPRALALLQSINRAILAYPGQLPNVEFSMCLGDWPSDPDHKWPLWVLTRAIKDEEKWVIPDFGYWSWPGDFMGEYGKLRREIQENEPDWEEKKPQAVWRGATATNNLRNVLVEKTLDKPWADVHAIDWQNNATLLQYGLTIPQHCNYQYLLHTEGHSYSGRGKYLLNCKSVSVIHTPDWIEPHTHLFIHKGPHQNMVSVDRDWKKLEKAVTSLIKNPTRAKQIAENSAATFRDRYLTPAAQACYWRQLIQTWSTISFQPELFHDVQNQDGTIRRVVRGKAFETFVSEMVFPPEDELAEKIDAWKKEQQKRKKKEEEAEKRRKDAEEKNGKDK